MSIDEEKITAVYDRINNLGKTKGISQIESCNICNINLHSHKNRIVKKDKNNNFFIFSSVSFIIPYFFKFTRYPYLKSGFSRISV